VGENGLITGDVRHAADYPNERALPRCRGDVLTSALCGDVIRERHRLAGFPRGFDLVHGAARCRVAQRGAQQLRGRRWPCARRLGATGTQGDTRKRTGQQRQTRLTADTQAPQPRHDPKSLLSRATTNRISTRPMLSLSAQAQIGPGGL
jgi:hypothetical protein